MSPSAYPLRCQPFFRDYLWGGRRLQSHLSKTIPEQGVWAESWEMIDHAEHSSRILNGPLKGMTLGQVVQQHPQWLLGSRLKSLPLLLKYLDCNKVLSVQVHPNDQQAALLSPPDLGKTEAWYIIDTSPGAALYAGLQPGTTREDLARALDQGNVEPLLHRIQPRSGDCIFIPAGTVHALGAGLLVAEIQQASNTTFRLFDWNRIGPDGKPRPLHIQQSLDVTDFQSGGRMPQQPMATEQTGRERLVACDKFIFDRISSVSLAQLGGDGKFHFITTPSGGVFIEGPGFSEQLQIGESLLLPASLSDCHARLDDSAVLLDMYVPD